MRKLLKDTTIEVIRAIAPLVVVIILLQFAIVKAPSSNFIQFCGSVVMMIAGMILFLIGIEVGILPAGKDVGAGLVQRRNLWVIMGVAFVIGFATTIAEPDVIVLSHQADTISQGMINGDSLVYIIGIGLGIYAAMAMLRIVFGFHIAYILAASYIIIIILSFFTPPGYISLAFDSGSVTTGALTTPVVLALGIGLSSVIAGRSAISDGFGILGMGSIGPIIAVLIMGILTR
ncbi:MAG: DUF1538 domain-containing protein [Dehalococcoidales bacterium]|nr:DUF1538 domain-containing protein [Dehalococcoidales bacterium]